MSRRVIELADGFLAVAGAAAFLGCFATPVVVRGRLVVRTTEELVAFDVSAR